MQDYLVKAMSKNGEIRAFSIDATQTVREAQERFDLWSGSSAALGRTLIATALFSKNMKNDERLMIQVQGDGLGGKIFTEGLGNGDVRGYIQHPNIAVDPNEQGKIDVRKVVGTSGTITVIKDLGMKEPFSGQIPIVDGELGSDFTYYMAVSEQINGAIGVSVYVDTDDSIISAGGFMIQLMPGATEETITELEERLAKLPQIYEMMAAGDTPEDMLERILGEGQVNLLSTEPIRYRCSCNRERFNQGLMSIGEKDIQELIDEDNGAEVVCHFCNKKYQYTAEDLEQLIETIKEKRLLNEQMDRGEE
ncbi:Hsp33 family molecular chaperone HslO [Atopobacter phocae]|uniref:Hsp33 family molecular chaperone HslO n=1 Tax=Atopobacter phocae TaxID=136492 RepID=UPI00046F0804|nr:Hsp33 family molecular chaperone HslO [Atopobacter phocae]